ncbi:Protein of unknown function [Marinobacter segnicrescens]|uniref:DUF1631 domain-containing protein n=1 Tax=Marinobacter segnicrescens TaxID=430453 RepID=A0A1I0B2M8_9GAMM|nr:MULTISPECIES: DUF1631 domain-containing protein [Marinobacter]UZD66954.1 DUF1631 domain-containing protein [Marinobacter sp. AN1]SET00926.1 Protein of unknown function [Marinobacter segnicrescens]
MNRQSGIHYLHDRPSAGGPVTVPPEVSRIRDTVVAGLGDLLQGAFDAVDDSLFELANNARSNNEQNRYFEAMREIRIKRKGVEKQFQHSVGALFDHPPLADADQNSQDQPRQQDSTSADSLSLVQDDELEEQVALSAMISKARAYFQGPLLQLQTRFTVIYPTASEERPVNPMLPDYICRAFANAAGAFEIQIRERLIVLKQFDRYVIANLGMLMDEANRILVQAGVVPNFRYQGKTRQEHTDTTATDPTTQGRGQAAETAGNYQVREDDALFQQIRQLLAEQRGHRSYSASHYGAGHGGTEIHIVGGTELLQMLSQASANTTGQSVPQNNLSAGEPVTVDLRDLVEHILESRQTEDGKQPALQEMDEDLINLVSMLFEFILDDYNLSAPIQVLISRLQIPILKVVIKDKSFFSRANHPARKLLNSLARAGIGWSNADEKSRDKLYEQIHNIVARILEDFDGDVTLFETLGDEFDQFLTRENRKASLVEQRTRESERGRIKSQKAQETVDRTLREKLERRPVPPAIHDILMNGWSRVMFLAYLRDDVEHRWEQSVRVVDDLVWCLHPHLDDDERDQWVRVVPRLLKALRAGLEEVSYNSSRLDDMMAKLKHELTEAFRNLALAEAREAGQPEPVVPPPEEAVEDTEEPLDAGIAEFLPKIDAITIGQWVEFRLVNGSSFRCKLSAVIDEADCFVFVNRMGLKVIEKTRIDLAHEMHRGRLTILEQGALIDRALDAVVGSLRKQA